MGVTPPAEANIEWIFYGFYVWLMNEIYGLADIIDLCNAEASCQRVLNCTSDQTHYC